MIIAFGIRMSEPKSNQNQPETTEPETTDSESGPLNRINRRNLLKGVTAATFLGTTVASAREKSRQAELAFKAELASLGTYSEKGRARRQEFPFQYAVKLVCGNSQERGVVPGRYRTAINLHNPNEEPAEFAWKVARAVAEQPGGVSDFLEPDFQLEPDQALEIDCQRIYQRFDEIEEREFFKGFVVIETNVELDVVAVYSAGEDIVETLDVERVEPRDLRGDEDDGRPDLVPVPDPEIHPPFCRRNEAGDLLVVVENQGTAAAGSSTTRVEFGTNQVEERDTPSLDAGDSVTHTISLPTNPSCFRPDCPFTITVDANDDVSESNEMNNVRDGICIG